MKILDRYIFRNFLEPFLMCFLGFIAIWLVFDLMGNLRDFLDADASFKQVARFYATQLPDITVVSLPVGLLLALLFSLSRMSRSNEIISMLTAGRSIVRILLPLFFMGLLCSAFCLVLNYEWAPHAAAIKKVALEQITKSKNKGDRTAIDGYLFRDRMNDRTWFVRRLRPDSAELWGVHITQQDQDGNIVKKWYARMAAFDSQSRSWTLNRGLSVEFSPQGDILKSVNFATSQQTVTGWSETPWRILSSHLEAQNLSVPELSDYLKYNADFPPEQLAPYETYRLHRWAFPFQCFVVILTAAPLSIAYSRRGIVGGVAGAMVLYGGLLLSTYLFLALGKGGRISPLFAAWFPNAFFSMIGLILLYFRSTNRDLPSLAFTRKRK